MNCDTCLEEMSDLLDGNLSPADETALRDHLRGCDRCRTAFEDLERATRLVRGLRSVEPPPDLLQQVRRRLDAEERRRERSFWVILRFPQTRVALAAAALLLIAFYGYRFVVPSVQPEAAPRAVRTAAPEPRREMAPADLTARDPALSAETKPATQAPALPGAGFAGHVAKPAAAALARPEEPSVAARELQDTGNRTYRKQTPAPEAIAGAVATDRIWRAPRPAADELAVQEEAGRRSRNASAGPPAAATPAAAPTARLGAKDLVRQEAVKRERAVTPAGALQDVAELQKAADTTPPPAPVVATPDASTTTPDLRGKAAGGAVWAPRSTVAAAPSLAPGAVVGAEGAANAVEADKKAQAAAVLTAKGKAGEFRYAAKSWAGLTPSEVRWVVTTRDPAAVEQVLRPYRKEAADEAKKTAVKVVAEARKDDADPTAWVTFFVPIAEYSAVLAKLQALGNVTLEPVAATAASVAAQSAADAKAQAAAESVTVRARILSQ